MNPASSPLAGKLLRFGLVGVPVTVSYGVSAYAAVRWLAMAPWLANLVGCAAAIAVSYIGQKYFTFRSHGAHQLELPKFLVTCVVAIVASSLCIAAITRAGVDYRLGLLTSALLIALCNFTVMNLWVFTQAQSE